MKGSSSSSSNSSEMPACERERPPGIHRGCQAPKGPEHAPRPNGEIGFVDQEGQRARCFVSSWDEEDDRVAVPRVLQELGAKSGIGCSFQRIRSVPIKSTAHGDLDAVSKSRQGEKKKIKNK